MKIGVIVDKWKGTLSAKEASQIIVDSWVPFDNITLDFYQNPMSDGGEGFGEIVGQAMGGSSEKAISKDATGRSIDVDWWYIEEEKTGVFETAESNGLARLLPEKYHPFELDTYGVGQVISQISQKAVRKLFLGIGGSATNDGGFGMARAIGYRFMDGQKNEITKWTDLDSLVSILHPEKSQLDKLASMEFNVACDVENPLLGASGATEIFGPQKGLTSESDRATAERKLLKLSQVVNDTFGMDFASMPGAGAAGGLGFGLAAFCQAKFHHGFQMFAELSELDSLIRNCDLIVTGEGKFDSSSLMGKGAGGVLEMCVNSNTPVIIVCGAADINQKLPENVLQTWALSEHFSIDDCFAKTSQVLSKLIHQMSSQLDLRRI